jgi:hypothetical protein
MYIGTTAVAINRGSGALSLTGVSIDGNAATITSQANSATINASTGVNGNDIVRRDANGYIYANHVNFNTGVENPTIANFITDNGDGWSRKSSLAHVKNQIRGIADGTWGISISGNAATASNSSQLQGYQWTSSGKNVRGQEIYVDGWFRNYTSGNGLYNEATGNHFYSDGQYWNVAYGGTTGIRLRNGHAGTILGYLYAETNRRFGLLNANGAWSVVTSPDDNKYVLFGGGYDDNAHSANPGVRLLLGGGNGDAISNYYIGTNLNNYGGNYTKLDLAWHTGIRIGAQQTYGGVRFYDSEDFGTVVFSVNTGDGNVRTTNTHYAYAYRGNGNVGGTGEASWHPAGIYSGGTQWLYGDIYRNSAATYGGGAAYYTILYDNNNTAYYCDPNGTARLSYVVANGGIRIDGNEDLYLDHNYGQSIVGVYTSTRYQGVFAMGTSYRLPKDGSSTGSLYGLAWSHPNAGGVAGNLNTHGLLAMENGSWLASLTGSTRSRDDMRAPLFYDNNNTGYYTDPASTTVLYNLTLAGAKHTYLNIDPGNGHEAMVYYNGGGSGSPWYVGKRTTSQVVGTESFHFYSVAASRTLAGVDTSGNMMSDGSMRSPVFYDYNDTGYYIDPNSTSDSALRIRGGALHGPNTSWSAYLWVGTNGRPDSNASVCATNGNLHMDCANGYAMYLNYYSGNVIYATDFRPNIIYDQQNTAYYIDPNSTTYLYNLILAGGGYFRPNNWIQLDGNYGLYWPNSFGAHIYPNTGSTYTQLRTDGQKNGYDGIWLSYSAVAGMMYDSAGNGGVYREANGRWYFYYHLGNDCMGIGTSSTSSTYSLYLNKGVYAQSRVDATIFYDTNDTGYYCDPASTSYMYRTIFQGRMLFYGADQSADGTNDAQLYFTPGGGLTIASITTSFETGFVGSSYPQNRQVGAQATYDKRFYVWQDLVQYYSDERLKEKTGTLNGALEAIKSWTPFKYVDNALANSFNFGSGKTQIGLSAQEVEAFYPELVELAPFDVENDFSDETNPRRISKSGENYLTLNYTRLVPILVQAIKEQQAKIEELENRINNS